MGGKSSVNGNRFRDGRYQITGGRRPHTQDHFTLPHYSHYKKWRRFEMMKIKL